MLVKRLHNGVCSAGFRCSAGPISFARSGLTLSLPASLCLRQGKCLPSFFAPLSPPLAAVARSPKEIGERKRRIGEGYRQSRPPLCTPPPETEKLGSLFACLHGCQLGRKEAPPVAEPSDRSGWAGTWFCTSKAQGKALVPTRTTGTYRPQTYDHSAAACTVNGEVRCVDWHIPSCTALLAFLVFGFVPDVGGGDY